MRLVISQYYTPSGRCIQKPFNMTAKEYDMEVVERFESGEITMRVKSTFPIRSNSRPTRAARCMAAAVFYQTFLLHATRPETAITSLN
jgi:carboxyl-terminal processing protease